MPVFLSLMVTVSSQWPSIVKSVSFPSRNFPLTALVNSPPPRKGLNYRFSIINDFTKSN